jgi:uncharacterized protein Usg|tara:strand:+ start:357 stop:575 length:219 start_codon:yes stop_codon:yes gene_type:complete
MELKIGSMIVREPVLIRIYYYLPDYSSLVQEFIWGTMDIIPEYPRINTFLNYWHENIDAVIASIDIDPYKGV